MDNAVETTKVQQLKPIWRVGLFSRLGMMAAILGSFVFVAVVIAAMQSKSQAQSGQARAMQAAARVQAAAAQRSEQNIERITNPTTGVGYNVFRNTAIGGSSSRALNAELAMEADLFQLAHQYRNATPPNQDSIRQALTQKLTEVFEARHQEQVSRAEKLRTELQQTQELLDKRVQLKPKIIERRLKELTGQQDELSWNPQSVDFNPRVASSGLPFGNLPLNPPPQFTNPPIGSSGMPLGGLPQENPQQLSVPPSYSTTPPNPTNLSVPLSSSPIVSHDEPTPLFLPSPSPAPGFDPTEKASKEDAPRSFMAAGFKLKNLMQQFEDAKQKLGNAHPQLVKLQNMIEEPKAVWDFEKQTLLTELEASESEMAVVQKQRELAIDQQERQNAMFANGSSSQEDLTIAERNVLSAERDLLQVRFRINSAKNAIEWANDLEEKNFKALRQAPATLE